MSSTNPHASLLGTLAEITHFHLQELHHNPQHLVHNKQQMLAILQNCFSLSRPQKEEDVVAVHKSDPTDRIHPGSAASGGLIDDYGFFKDSVAQSRVANSKSLIDIVHGYFLKAGMNKEAEEYLKMVSSVSLVQNLESIKLWNYQTLPFKVYEGLEEMGFGESPLRFGSPPQFFPTPEELGWKPGQADVDGDNRGGCLAGLTESFATDDGGIAAETEVEEGASTAVEGSPAGVVVDIGEVTAQPVTDAAGEGNKKKLVMEMEDID